MQVSAGEVCSIQEEDFFVVGGRNEPATVWERDLFDCSGVQETLNGGSSYLIETESSF